LDASDPTRIALRVHNQGAIPAELVPTLFNPFRGSHAVPSKRGDGLGLGLFIAHEIAVSHGGSVRVDSPDPASTTFVVELSRTGSREAT
jgi:C4-dicarboxylate-specific signal transduction histidine kinase